MYVSEMDMRGWEQDENNKNAEHAQMGTFLAAAGNFPRKNFSKNMGNIVTQNLRKKLKRS